MSNLAIQIEESREGRVMEGGYFNSWLSLYSKLVVVSVFFLIFAGALVTSNDAGLAVPDWPTTFGYNMFLYPPSMWVGGVFFEHSHRLIASVVGLMTVVLTGWIVAKEKRRWVKNLALFSLGAVIMQGVLGGLTVLYLLPTPVSVAHGVLAQTFLVCTIIIAYSQSKEFAVRQQTVQLHSAKPFFKFAVLSAGAIYLQLIVGAIMRHSGAGLAIPDFPTVADKIVPVFDQSTLEWINSYLVTLGRKPVEMFQVLIHFYHRLGAVLVATVVLTSLIACARITWQNRLVRQGMLGLTALLFLQTALGISTVLSVRAPIITSLHVFFGAIMLGVATLVALRSYEK